MRRVLIYRKESSLMATGGPSGYLYNLKKGLDTLRSEEVSVDFLPARNNSDIIKSNIKKSNNIIVKKILEIFRVVKHVRLCFEMIDGKKEPEVDLSQYDVIHFHTTLDLHYLRSSLNDFKGKVLLTSHSPQPLAYEFLEASSKLELKLFNRKYQHMIDSDEYAFRRADYIVFPCEYADEPYLNMWDEYKRIKKDKISNYKYMLTGTSPCSAKRTRTEIREKYNIPLDAFVISYVGRHNEIKGYDRLQKVFEKIKTKWKNLYVIVAGNEGPIYSLKDDRWVEVGWTNDPHSIISASNTFILPNRETYFDLVMLEVISLGIPIIASYTGGNKYFEKYSLNGIKLFKDDSELIKLIEQNMEYNEKDYTDIRNANISLFNKEFTTESFAKNYIELIKSIT